MRRVSGIFIILLLIILISSCINPEKALENLAKPNFTIKTGIKAPIYATEVSLADIVPNDVKSLSGFNVDVNIPDVDMATAVIEYTLDRDLPLQKNQSEKLTINQQKILDFIPDYNSSDPMFKTIKLSVPFIMYLSVNSVQNNNIKIGEIDLAIKDGDDNLINYTTLPGNSYIVIFVDGQVLSFTQSGSITIQIKEATIVALSDVTLNTGNIIGFNISLYNDLNQTQKSEVDDIFNEYNVLTKNIEIYEVGSLKVDVSSLDYPQTLIDKSVDSLTFKSATVTVKSDQFDFSSVDTTSNFRVSLGDLVYELKDTVWSPSIPLNLSIGHATINFENPVNPGDLISVDAYVDVEEISLNFGTDGAELFKFDDTLKLPLPEDQFVNTATFTIAGSNTTGFIPQLRILINGIERLNLTMDESFEESITFTDNDIEQIPSGLPIFLEVRTTGEQTINLNDTSEKIKLKFMMDTDITFEMQGGE